MWGEYKHIQQYEAEIQRLKSEGYTHREIGQTLGFTKTQVKKFVERYNIKLRKIAAGMALKKRGCAIPTKMDTEKLQKTE